MEREIYMLRRISDGAYYVNRNSGWTRWTDFAGGQIFSKPSSAKAAMRHAQTWEAGVRTVRGCEVVTLRAVVV